MNGLQTLRERYPIPDVMPDVPMDYNKNNEPTGWCAGENRKLFMELCNDSTKIIVDGGSFLGLSAWWFLKLATNATVIGVDHWQGSREHQKGPISEKLPTLYETFLRNLWDWRDRIIPVRSDSVAGMKEIASLGIQPDIVYIDWSHDAENVCRDLTNAIELFPNAEIIGDDWTWKSVQEGVGRVVKNLNVRFVNNRTCYRLDRT